MRKASLTCITATVFGRTAKDEENDKLAIKSIGSNNVIRRLLCVVAVLVAFAVSVFAPAEAQTRTLTKQERDAVQVVNAWDAAWATKDAEKIGAFIWGVHGGKLRVPRRSQ